MEKHSKIYVAGHSGLVGSALLRRLKSAGYTNIVYARSADFDLRVQQHVSDFFRKERPEYVFLCAARVGGILANQTYPAHFFYDNVMISTNVIHSAYENGVKKLLNLGSSCIYPRLAPQPMREDSLLTSPLEPTNEAYALAKIAAIKQCTYYNEQFGTNFISAMPTNQYGVGDNFHMERAHVLPMLLRRFHLAKLLAAKDFDAIAADVQRFPLGFGLDDAVNARDERALERALHGIGAFADKVIVWGDGSAYREFMHSDDLADACLFLMRAKNASDIGEFVNITSGTDIQLTQLFDIIKDIVDFRGTLEYDITKPNGTPRKLMDAQKIQSLGWRPKTPLRDGIESLYAWYTNI